jgi:FemAB-related protein (PEP-CTERM system-associated)
VIGYRAPKFSIGKAQQWAYDILVEEGFRYDSSMFPILHDRYGQVTAPRFPYEIWRTGSAHLMEFPIGTTRMLGVNFPIGGGGYFRLAPEVLFRMGINRVNTRERQPVMFYLHPWEVDPGQPRQPMAWHHRFRLYVGLEKTAAKLDRLLAQFRFGTARDVLKTLFQSHPLHDPATLQPRSGIEAGITVSRIALDQVGAWDRLINQLPVAHLAHAPEWATIIGRAYRHEPMYLSAQDDTGRSGLLPAFIVRRPLGGTVITSMPFLDGGGPAAASTDLSDALVARLLGEAHRIGARSVELRCAQRLGLAIEPRMHKVNMVLELPADPAALWRRLDGSVRNQIRKAEKAGLSVESGGVEHLAVFYALFAARMRDLGSPAHSPSFLRAVLESFGTRARIVLIRKDQTPVGGLVAIAFKDTVVVPWASCRKEYFALCPNMLLYWETIRAACADGYRRFDFGRSSPDSGTYRFKRQWGVQETPLFWYSVPMVLRHQAEASDTRDAAARAIAKLAVTMWQRLPLGATHVLGPRVRRYFIQ